MSPLSQTATAKDNEASLPTSAPWVSKFKEASLPSSPKEKESFYVTNVTCQGYAPAGPWPLGTRSTTSSRYNTIHQELGLYNPSTRSNPTNKFF
jgi:hypothetical protein